MRRNASLRDLILQNVERNWGYRGSLPLLGPFEDKYNSKNK